MRPNELDLAFETITFGFGIFVGRKPTTGTQASTEEYDAITDPGAT